MLTQTPRSERTYIAFFGAVNAGKSSVVNRIAGSDISIVSDRAGTTTDPVLKSMELLPLGPVVLCDTAGLGDNTALGMLRMEKTYEILRKTDIAVLVIDATCGKQDADNALIAELTSKNIPYILCYNKADLHTPALSASNEIAVSAATGSGIEELKQKLASYAPAVEKTIVTDLFHAKDTVILVTPIDEAAPKGRLILPEQLVLRELLDIHALPVVVQTEELADALAALRTPPAAVITDSQAFGTVKDIVPESVYLTSFSILMQRYKGILDDSLKGLAALDKLRDGDRVLICEGCTHHRQCNDIGTVKLPAWIRKHTGASLEFSFTQGGTYPADLSPYALIVHCGGCMLNAREMRFRQSEAARAGVPFTNYGLAISHMNGILERSIKILQK